MCAPPLAASCHLLLLLPLLLFHHYRKPCQRKEVSLLLLLVPPSIRMRSVSSRLAVHLLITRISCLFLLKKIPGIRSEYSRHFVSLRDSRRCKKWSTTWTTAPATWGNSPTPGGGGNCPVRRTFYCLLHLISHKMFKNENINGAS